jgi:hypothetical protein
VAQGRVSFTADSWTDHNHQSWFFITGHWIAKDTTSNGLQLKNALITFHPHYGTHDGKNMAGTAMGLLDRADVTANVLVFQTVLWLLNHCNLTTMSQVGHWALDNAPNNGTFMEELGHLLCQCDIDFDHLERRIMCFPHVVNICCQHVIAKFTKINLIELAHVAELPPTANEQSFNDTIKSDPIARGRNILRVLQSSGQHRARFNEVIVDGNAKGWFVVGDKVVVLPSHQLLRDVQTRWDSVYLMI